MTATDDDVTTTAGRIHLRRQGGSVGPMVLCLPGLSANAISFDPLGAALAAGGRRVAALDLRGRGRSPATAPGGYGWPAHATDVLEVARALGGGDPVDLVGHSMGAYVAMCASAVGGDLVRRIVLLDAAGRPEPAAIPPILAALERLGAVAVDRDAFLAGVRGRGTVEPWNEVWARHYLDDLEEVPGGVRPRTDREAVLEDVRWGAEHDPADLWAGVRHPALVIRATRPLGPEGGSVLSRADLHGFVATVPGSEALEVDAGHYGVVMDPVTIAAVVAFLDGSPARV